MWRFITSNILKLSLDFPRPPTVSSLWVGHRLPDQIPRRDLMMRKLFLKLVFSMTERFNSILLVILEQWENGETLLQTQGHLVMCSGKQHLGEFVNAGALSALVCSNLSLLQTAQIEHPPKLQSLLYLRNIMNEISMKSLGTFRKKNTSNGSCRFYHVSATWFRWTASAFPKVWISVRWRMWWQIHPVSWSQAQLRSDAAMAWYYSWDPMSLGDDGRSMIPGTPDFKGKECPILFLGVRNWILYEFDLFSTFASFTDSKCMSLPFYPFCPNWICVFKSFD